MMKGTARARLGGLRTNLHRPLHRGVTLLRDCLAHPHDGDDGERGDHRNDRCAVLRCSHASIVFQAHGARLSQSSICAATLERRRTRWHCKSGTSQPALEV